MDQVVNSLIKELLLQPLFLIMVIIGAVGIIVYIYIKAKNSKNSKIDNDPMKQEVKENKILEKRMDSVDKTCPKCGGKIVLRNGKYGRFYGCSNYPNCKYTEKF